MSYVRTRILASAALAVAASALVAAGPAAAADTTPPAVQSVTVTGPATIDTTFAEASVPVRVRITDAGGVLSASLVNTYTRASSAHPASLASGEQAATLLQQVSGTVNDGIYEGRVTVRAGTRGTWAWSVRAEDFDRNVTLLSPQQLAAKGFTSSVQATTTKAPSAPRLTSELTFPWYNPHLTATVRLTAPTGSPVFNGQILVSANAACGTPTEQLVPYGRVFIDKRFLEQCTVVIQAVNAAGASPSSTISFR